ncbi:PLP-dependent aminotransferase family protein [Gallaecimonas kandeliae]|uniref:MocR-like pyridoxine biosynthesis transcription factor PdxR n=1 Tax=Gallaecimonas kandeliae TaxID=3029055 RepID=UPI002647EFF3|nr:PLP-dependent aminotransferase family protein [Gallaecimonas kandeliae]WKE67277.1 PLP-dependent aminotransferase family protein [Gallaecimonas kandeliae]
MELHLVIEGDRDLGAQLYRQLKDAIRSGRLAPGSQLPPSRLLAKQLGLSRKTVADTYALLTYDNLLQGKVGVGTFVSPRPPEPNTRDHQPRLASANTLRRWQGIANNLRHPPPDQALRYEFLGGAVTKTHFPQDDWRRCVQHALRQADKSRGLYSQPAGLPALRHAIAHHIGFSRGVQCQADDLVVCNGAQQALDLLARVLVEPGCLVAVEEPGYPPARQCFEAQGAKVQGVPVDAEGLVVDAIPEGVRLIYVTPSHQFPLGMPMSDARRKALLAKAEALGAVIIEDDYDCEFRYEGRPLDTLYSLDQAGLVAYVGTFSKTLLPELRLGYTVLPPSLQTAVIAARHLIDRHSPTLSQWALVKFIEEGLLLKHIRRCHELFSSRRERLLARFQGDLAPWFELVPSVAGFHLTALARQKLDLVQLIAQARQRQLGLYPIDGFYHEGLGAQGLLLGYGAIETLDIDPALDILGDILTQLAGPGAR